MKDVVACRFACEEDYGDWLAPCHCAGIELHRLNQVRASPLLGALAEGLGATVGAGGILHLPHLQRALHSPNFYFISCEIFAKSSRPIFGLRSIRFRAVFATAAQSSGVADDICNRLLCLWSTAGPGDGKDQTDL